MVHAQQCRATTLKLCGNETEKMEHRLKKRCQLSLGVIVHGRDNMALQGMACDISTDGMFIQLEQAVPKNAVVEIELPHCGHLHGWVVHAKNRGIGVMFRSISSHEKELIGQLCERAGNTARSAGAA